MSEIEVNGGKYDERWYIIASKLSQARSNYDYAKGQVQAVEELLKVEHEDKYDAMTNSRAVLKGVEAEARQWVVDHHGEGDDQRSFPFGFGLRVGYKAIFRDEGFTPATQWTIGVDWARAWAPMVLRVDLDAVKALLENDTHTDQMGRCPYMLVEDPTPLLPNEKRLRDEINAFENESEA